MSDLLWLDQEVIHYKVTLCMTSEIEFHLVIQRKKNYPDFILLNLFSVLRTILF